jgi:hypothetical protein
MALAKARGLGGYLDGTIKSPSPPAAPGAAVDCLLNFLTFIVYCEGLQGQRKKQTEVLSLCRNGSDTLVQPQIAFRIFDPSLLL